MRRKLFLISFLTVFGNLAGLWLLKGWFHAPLEKQPVIGAAFIVLTTATFLLVLVVLSKGTWLKFLRVPLGSMVLLAGLFMAFWLSLGSPCTLRAFAGPNAGCSCSSWDARPCSGWSTSMGKFVSCSVDGISQDGFACQGCCFEYSCPTPEPPDPLADTPTPTDLPTATPEPTSTPTPLPPELSSSLSCDQAGMNGWCLGGAKLFLTASDPQGFAVSISGNAGGIQISCDSACDVNLPEGEGTASFTANSASGRSASGSHSWKYDASGPTVQLLVDGAPPASGWYSAPVMIGFSASDAVSGVGASEVSLDGANWQSSLDLSDGRFTLQARAFDVAGNSATTSSEVKVDTTPPQVVISGANSPSDVVARGTFILSGSITDADSGVQSAEISLDGGVNWYPLALGSEGRWTYPWDTASLPNGKAQVLVRGKDIAGNNSSISTLSVVVDNQPPLVDLQESWAIWEAGRLSIHSSGLPVAKVRVTISDPEGRWPRRVLELDASHPPHEVRWDRHFGDGTVAPIGHYEVEVSVSDIYGNSGHDTGVIVIPAIPTSTPTNTSTPTTTMTTTLSPSTPSTPSTSWTHRTERTPIPAVKSPKQEPAVLEAKPVDTGSLKPLALLLALLGGIAAACYFDPRPHALNNLGEILDTIQKQNHQS